MRAAQVGGRSGLTAFPFEADATADALRAAFLAMPRDPTTSRAPHEAVAAALGAVGGRLKWVASVQQSLLKAARNNSGAASEEVARIRSAPAECATDDGEGVSFEDLVEAMERAWESSAEAEEAK